MEKIILSLTTFFICNALLAQDDPAATRIWEPQPSIVTPGKTPQDPPADAIILFNGKDMSGWVNAKGEKAGWKVKDGVMTVEKNAGDIHTTRSFGNCQLHIEWRTPKKVVSEGQGRGNSGVFLMGKYEVQVLDNYNNKTYANGQAGSIYKQYIPLVNVCRPPGEWQTYDIVFTAPVFKDSVVISPGRFTVFQNGVLIQNNVELKGETVDVGQPFYKKHDEKTPLLLQDHGNPVSYRNIWIREL